MSSVVIYRSIVLAISLLAAGSSIAQQPDFKDIQGKFANFSSRLPNEKIYLHTDKDAYLAGEIVSFKIYYTNAATLLPIANNKISFVEVIDRGNKPVLQAKIELTEKGGSGSFYLPVSLLTDNYVIRAYTSDVRTGRIADVFEKALSVVNTIKPPDARLSPEPAKVSVNFFPEGGNLVQGVETKMAFHITDQNGDGIDARGVVTDQHNDTILSFSSQKFGIGSFSFKPRAGNSYKGIIQLQDGRTVTNVFPSAYEYGFVMNATDNKDGRIAVRVQARGTQTDKRGENVFLLVHSRQVTRMAETGFVNYENDLVFYIDKNKLTEGVNHLTLFNKDQRPVCERLVFIKPKARAAVKIQSDKGVYGPRQPVSVTFSSDSISKLLRSDYSIAVYKTDSLQVQQEDLASYLFLTSDLRGTVEAPSYYLSNDQGADAAVDNLLLTHGWRRFKWENVLSQKIQPAPLALPEPKGHLITARVVSVANQKPASGVDCFLSCPGTPFGLYTGKSNENGIVQFDVSNYYGPGEIIIQAGRDTMTKYRVDVLTPFSEIRLERSLPVLSFTKDNESAIIAKSIAMQAQNIYLVDSMGQFDLPQTTDTLPFFGKSEFSYRLDEYKRFTTMEEVLREYVRPINVVMRNSNLHMRVFDELYFSLYGDGPQSVYGDNVLVLLDGVPLMNYNKIFLYDPLKLKKLDVIPRRYMIGGINFKGIVSFESYSGKFEGFELTPGVVAVDYEGLQLQREFYSPVYATNEQRQKRVPDFRSTLYWTPNVTMGQNGEATVQFYTSDLHGKYLVVLQGFNTKGEPVSATSSFSIE